MSELEVAERALSFTDGDAQVTVTRERSLHSRFARSVPTQATAIADTTVHVLALRDGHVGTATTNALDDDGLRAVTSEAAHAASAAAERGPGRYPGLPEPQPAARHAGHDAETANLGPGTTGAALAAAFDVAREHGVEAFGLWSGGEVRTAIASTTGIRAEDAVTDAYCKVMLRDDEGRSGFASHHAVATGAIDGEAVAREAATKLPRGDRVELEPGTYPVVLGEHAVGLLLAFLGGLAFDGLAHAEGRGSLSGRLGERIAPATVTLTDDPRAAATLPRAIDAEGVPKHAVALIDAGIARSVVHDTRSAAIAGVASTGHALLPGGSPFGAAPTNLVLAGGDEADPVASIERGVYVNRFWYVNPVDAKATLLTGVTRDGTFLIEDGRITRPVRDMRFTDTVLGVLERTEGLGTTPRLVSEAEFYGRRFATGVVCPPLRSALKLTGGA